MAGEIASAISQLGINPENPLGLSTGINKFLIALTIFIVVAMIIYFIYWIKQRQKYNIVIRGHDLRGSQDVEFDDKAREFITISRAELKLLKRKNANVIIPNLKYYRSMADGRRVIHIFKYGAVNDYVVLDPQIVVDTDEVMVRNEKGEPVFKDKVIINKKGEVETIKEPIIINKIRYDMHITESLGKEHSVRDLRDALGRFKTQGTIEKYKEIIAIIIIGAVIIISAWLYGHYMLKTANVINDGFNTALEAIKQIQTMGSIS